MATLQAHGTELFRWSGICFEKAYMSDGTLLKNRGYGWKVHGKVKAGLDPVTVAESAKNRQAAMRLERPALENLRRVMVEVGGGLKNRVMIDMAFDCMPDDPDGVWAELDDNWETRGKYTFEDIMEIYRARQACQAEHETI